ncbi:restriction endonuclease subunit S [Candidatus Palauibacter sp.]|uniref:restriction endonuclease subunit S n=1 Tax=Candidatus Palauibacter sp. TaxID=3101350 RepID=UPI003B5AD4BB
MREIGSRCVRYGELYTRYQNYVVNPVSRIPKDVAATALRIEKGELLLAGSGETAEEIGICVAYIGEELAYAGGDIIVLRATGQDPVHLAHLLNAPVAARQKARMAQGDAVVHIRSDHLAEVECPLPPLPEQQAIAGVLFDMDTEIAALDRRLDKTRALKQGMMQQLLTGSIRLPIPGAVPEDEPGRSGSSSAASSASSHGSVSICATTCAAIR